MTTPKNCFAFSIVIRVYLRASAAHVFFPQTLKRLRVPNIMKHVMRCHDFGSGREAAPSEYREYSQGKRQSHGPKLVPALGVTAKIGANFVGRLVHIRDMACTVLRVTADFRT